MTIAKMHETNLKVFKGHLVLFSFSSPHSLGGWKWCMKRRLHNLSHRHPKITFLAWLPICILYMFIRHIWLVTLFGQKMLLHGVVCALALQPTFTVPHFIIRLWQPDFTLSLFLTAHIQPYLWRHNGNPCSSSTVSLQGSLLHQSLVWTLFNWRCLENLSYIQTLSTESLQIKLLFRNPLIFKGRYPKYF